MRNGSCDKLLLQRLTTYLEQNTQRPYLDVFSITRGLREIHPEYANQKFDVFRKLVSRAFRVVSESCGLSQHFSEDEEDGAEYPIKMVNPGVTATKKHPNELINILSSDESEEEFSLAKKPPLAPARLSFPKGNADRRKRSPSPEHAGPSKKPRYDSNNKVRLVRFSEPKRGTIFNERAETNRIEPQDFVGEAINATKKSNKLVKRTVYTRFHNVGGMDRILKELCENLIHFKCPEIHQQLGVRPPHGILIHGPNGCGKTLLAHAIAGQLKYDLIETSAHEILAEGIQGEAEEYIKDLFAQAMLNAPCVLFIDDVDLLTSDDNGLQPNVVESLLLQLLSSIDQLTSTAEIEDVPVLLVAASSRPEKVDRALCRRGRFDYEIAVPIPKRKDRVSILTTVCNEVRVERNIDFDKLAELTAGYVGADLLKVVVKAASMAAKRVCTKQMYEFKKKAESNMDVVDLDEDDAAGDAPQKEIDSTKNEVASNKIDTAGDTAEDTAKDTAEDTATAQEKQELEVTTENNDQEEETANENQGKENNAEIIIENNEKEENKVDEETVANRNASAPMDEKNEETPVPENKATENVPAATNGLVDPKANGPSLVELTNWLEYMPDECAIDENFVITFDDLLQAVKITQASVSKTRRFLSTPDANWEDIGGLSRVREELNLYLLAPIEHQEAYESLGLTVPSGILLCGPPGCGKSMAAKAVASSTGMNFIWIKGPELENMYTNGGDVAVRECFQRARSAAPCIVLFNDIDYLCPKHSTLNGDNNTDTRILNQLLIELDKVDENKGVHILASSDRPNCVNPLLLSRGRFDQIIYVDLPNVEARVEILSILTKNGTKPLLATDVDIGELASQTEGYTGADLAALMKRAGLHVFRERIAGINGEDISIRQSHLAEALKTMPQSIKAEDKELYESMRAKYVLKGITQDKIE